MEPLSRLGGRLRRIRRERNLSMEELARLTGVSKPMLSQIERGQSSPTVTTLWKIATGLKVPLSTFWEGAESEFLLADWREQEPLREDEGRMEAWPVFPFDPIRSVEVFRIRFAPGCRHPSEPHSEGVEEYILVTRGRLQMDLDGREVVAEESRSLRFRADIPHSYRNPFPEECVIYNIIFYPRQT